MDPVSALLAVPGIGPWVPYITVAITVMAALSTVLPAPEPGGNTAYAMIYNAVNFVAINFGHAKNATAPVPVPPDTVVPVVVAPAVTVDATVQEPKP